MAELPTAFAYWGFGSKIHAIDRDFPLCLCGEKSRKEFEPLDLKYDKWREHPSACARCLAQVKLTAEVAA